MNKKIEFSFTTILKLTLVFLSAFCMFFFSNIQAHAAEPETPASYEYSIRVEYPNGWNTLDVKMFYGICDIVSEYPVYAYKNPYSGPEGTYEICLVSGYYNSETDSYIGNFDASKYRPMIAQYGESGNYIQSNAWGFTTATYGDFVRYEVTEWDGVPYFDSLESLQTFLKTGNDDGQINKPGSDASYDATLDNIKNLTIKGLTPNDCHSSVDSFSNCFQLSWDVPNYDKTLYMDFYEIKFDMQYSYINYFGTSLKNSSGLIDYIVNGTKISIAVSEGVHNFCAHDFVDILGLNDNLSALDYISKFSITKLRKIYIRHVRVDRRSNDISFGNWSVYDVDYSNGIFSLNEKSTGDLNIYPGDSEIGSDGSFDSEPIESIPKPDKKPEFSFAGIDLDDIKSIGSYFIGLIQTLFNFLGDFPSLFARVFAFLPHEILTMIYVCIVIVCIAGLFKIFV